MKLFTLLLISALLVGCVGTVEKGDKSEQDQEQASQQETSNSTKEDNEAKQDERAEAEDEKETVEAESEAGETVELEEVDAKDERAVAKEEEDSDDEIETYVYESGTVTWSGSKKVGGGYEGTVDVIKAEAVINEDDSELVSAMFELDMTSINSGNGGLDGHLKNEDFFDVENHPTATLKLTEATPDEAQDTYMLSGTLEILGNEEPISFLATVKEDDDKVSARAEFEIDRTKWGITYGSGSVFDNLGDKVIKDEVGFVVDVVLAEQ